MRAMMGCTKNSKKALKTMVVAYITSVQERREGEGEAVSFDMGVLSFCIENGLHLSMLGFCYVLVW
jgi:hypothetical protein